jgi:small subunit ribosomal protein S1
MSPDTEVTAGQKVMVQVKDVNVETRRISLSIKDAGQDPWALAASKYPVGSTVTGTVERKESFGLIIALEDGISGLVPKGKALDATDFPFDKLKKGDSVTVQVLEVRTGDRRMTLIPPGSEDDKAWQQYAAQQKKPAADEGFGSLGDLLKKKMPK